jgi:hypothetical protein
MLRVIRRLALLLILFAASAAPAFEFDADEPPGTNIRVSPRGVAAHGGPRLPPFAGQPRSLSECTMLRFESLSK